MPLAAFEAGSMPKKAIIKCYISLRAATGVKIDTVGFVHSRFSATSSDGSKVDSAEKIYIVNTSGTSS